MTGILACSCLRPSTGEVNARYGDGGYFTDLAPDVAASGTPSQVSYALYNVPFNSNKVSHFVAVNPDEVDPEPMLVRPVYGTRFAGHSIYLSSSSVDISLAGAIKSYGEVGY